MNKILLGLLALALVPLSPAVAVDVGDPAPSFTLSNTANEEVSLDSLSDKVVVLEWFNQGCPFVRKHYREGDMPALQKEFSDKGVVWLAINSTNKDHDDYLTPAQAKELKAKFKMENAQLLLDPSGEVGKLYSAKTTPHLFIINKGTLVYQGAIDDKSDVFVSPKMAKNHVRAALNEILKGEPVSESKTKPYGCSIKYAD